MAPNSKMPHRSREPRVVERELASGKRWLDITDSDTGDDGRLVLDRLKRRGDLGDLPGVIEDRLMRPFERPRVTAEGEAVYFSFWWPGPDFLDGKDAATFGVLLAKSGIVTLHPRVIQDVATGAGEGDGRRGDGDARRAKRMRQGRAGDTSDGVLYALLEHAVGDFERLSRGLAEVAEHLSGAVRDAPPQRFFYRVLAVRQDALRLRHVLSPARAVFELLRAPNFTLVNEAWEPFFDDLADRVRQVIDDVEDVRLSLRETLDAHTTIHNDRQNKVMKVLTVISTFTLPTTLVASIYGMNFRIPEYGWTHGYAFSLGLMLAMMMSLFGYLQWRGWFR